MHSSYKIGGRSQNHTVNTGPTRGGGSAKESTMGKDTGKDATNVIKKLGCKPAEVSPSSTNQSPNRGKGTGDKKGY